VITWDDVSGINAQEDWEHARREAVFREVVCAIKGCSVDLLSFNEVKDRLHLTEMSYHGIHEIAIKHIRGSVGRYHDFATDFLPRKTHLKERWENVDRYLSRQGESPIQVYQVGEAYFVIDGNHRVSVARQLGRKSIQAEVWQYATPVELSNEADHDELLLKAEHANFLAQTQIEEHIPDHSINITTPGGYRSLIAQLETYRSGLEDAGGESVSMEEASLKWYHEVYEPSTRTIRESGVMDRYPKRTEADLFIWVWANQEDLKDFSPYDLREAFKGNRIQGDKALIARLKSSINDLAGKLSSKQDQTE
jgi:hypothetical protein